MITAGNIISIATFGIFISPDSWSGSTTAATPSDLAGYFLEDSWLEPEEVEYFPHTGASRRIKALVDRNPNQTIPGMERGSGFHIVITCANSATAGVDSSTVEKGLDTIGVAPRIGMAEQQRVIERIISQDDVLLTLHLI